MIDRKLEELLAENQMIMAENLKLRAKILELRAEIKRLAEWSGTPTEKNPIPELFDSDEADV